MASDPVVKNTRIPRRSLSQQNRNTSDLAQDDVLATSNTFPHLDPRLIYEAQTTSYWTGRFTSVHDRLRGELLEPSNLTEVVESFSEDAAIMMAHATAPNNPSTSAYAPSTALRPRGIILPSGHTRIPLSSTDSAVQQSVRPATMQQPHQRRGRNRDAAVSMLIDDDSRRRRAMEELEALCATAEARQSLHT